MQRMQATWMNAIKQICSGFKIKIQFQMEAVAWMIRSKHTMECWNLKDRCSTNLKSMRRTISPMLINFAITQIWDGIMIDTSFFLQTWWIWVLWRWPFSNLHMVRMIYMYTWTCEMAGLQCWFDHEWSSTLGSLIYFLFSCGNLPEGRESHMMSCIFHNSIEHGVIPLKLATI